MVLIVQDVWQIRKFGKMISKEFITIAEARNSRAIECESNNHGRCINRYDDKIVSISKFGTKCLICIENVWKAWMRTITIDEFKNLVAADSPERVKSSTKISGRFGISLKSQKKQCENLKVGDKVFFLNAIYEGLTADNIPRVDMVVTEAIVVDSEEGN